MSEAQQRRIEAIDAGREASIMSGVVGPWIADKITDEVKRMVAEYRGGEMTHDRMVGTIAGIAMLMTLTSDLESTQRRANVAADKEFGNAPQAR